MCTVLLPPGDNLIAVNKYIIYKSVSNSEWLSRRSCLNLQLIITVSGNKEREIIWCQIIFLDFNLKFKWPVSYT